MEEVFNIKITDENTENLKNVGHLVERVKNVQNSL
jgi:acyl carrier protein